MVHVRLNTWDDFANRLRPPDLGTPCQSAVKASDDFSPYEIESYVMDDGNSSDGCVSGCRAGRIHANISIPATYAEKFLPEHLDLIRDELPICNSGKTIDPAPTAL